MRTHGLWAHSRRGIETPGRADGARCASLRLRKERYSDETAGAPAPHTLSLDERKVIAHSSRLAQHRLPHHRIENREELPHTRREREFLRFAGRDQAGIEGADVQDCAERAHVGARRGRVRVHPIRAACEARHCLARAGRPRRAPRSACGSGCRAPELGALLLSVGHESATNLSATACWRCCSTRISGVS